jgi:hypothetical protein
MANGRALDWENPLLSRRIEARILDRDPIRELHQGLRSDAPHREAGHMSAPDRIATTAACGSLRDSSQAGSAPEHVPLG